MSLINLRERTINAKIVYYGMALSGKTTSLKQVHQTFDPEGKVELVSLNTDGDRTLFFDFLPLSLGKLSGFQVKLQAFTVPGQVKYNLTRRYVLRGADAVIFVADSRAEVFDDNLRSFESLQENLAANGLDIERIPLLLQYNKRDDPDALPIGRLNAALNSRGWPEVESVAIAGKGVFEGFTEVCANMMEALANEYRIGDPAEARRVMKRRLATFANPRAEPDTDSQGTLPAPALEQQGRDLATEAIRTSVAEAGGAVIHVPSSGEDSLPTTEDLLEQAVETQIKSAVLMAELNETKRRLADHVHHLAALHETGVVISSELGGERLLGRVLDAALRTVGAGHGSVLLLSRDGTALEESLVRGFQLDPIACGGATDPHVLGSVLQGQAFVLGGDDDGYLLEPPPSGEIRPRVALVSPLVHQGEVLGALTAYLFHRPQDEDVQMRLRFLAAVAAQAGVALQNSRLYEEIESFNHELELKVAARTRELQKAYRELKVLDALKDDFLSSMSHELLTPLTSIRSSAEILVTMADDEGPDAAGERTEFASMVHGSACKLTDMLEDVLAMSRLEAGEVNMALGSLDLRDVLLQSYRELRPRFHARGMKVRLRVDPELPPAIGDARWVRRVFDALLSNAAKFAIENSNVHVTLRQEAMRAVVSVRDAGPGMPQALRNSIFEKFKQLGDALTDKPPGLGLGLPLAKSILEHMNGEIWLESSTPEGSEFAFALPLIRTPVRTPTPTNSEFAATRDVDLAS